MIIRFKFINNLVGTTLAVCLCLAVVGNLVSWSSPVVYKLQNTTDQNPLDYAISKNEASWLSSILTVGAVAGTWIFGIVSDKIGRKPVLLSLALPVILGYILMISINNMACYIGARFLQGLSMGGAFNMFSTYMGEITNRNNRSVIMTINGVFVSVGSLYCYSVGPWVSFTTLNILQLLLPIFYLSLALVFLEESPYFYLMKNNEDSARNALSTYRSINDKCFEEDIVQMKEQVRKQQEGNILNVMKTTGYYRALLIAMVMMSGQQLTGINVILMYSQTIFDLTGSSLSPDICSIILAAIQLVSGAIAPFITNRFGKRHILIASGIGMALSEATLGIYCVLQDSGKDLSAINFLPILTLTLFMLNYNYGFGPLCWVVTGEVFPTRVKTLSMSFSISLYFAIGFIISQFFNTLVDAIGIGAIFLVFSGCCLATIAFVKFYLFETSGKTFEEIQDRLNSKKTNVT